MNAELYNGAARNDASASEQALQFQCSDDDDSDADTDDSGQTATTDDHRAALGSLIQNLQDRGVDVDSLAQEAGLDTADVNSLEHDDLLQLGEHIAQNHPELTRNVLSRFPFAQNLLSRFLG